MPLLVTALHAIHAIHGARGAGWRALALEKPWPRQPILHHESRIGSAGAGFFFRASASPCHGAMTPPVTIGAKYRHA